MISSDLSVRARDVFVADFYRKMVILYGFYMVWMFACDEFCVRYYISGVILFLFILALLSIMAAKILSHLT